MLAAAPTTLADKVMNPATLQPWGRLLGTEELQTGRCLEKTGDQRPHVVGAMAQLSLPTLCLQVAPSLLGAALRAAGHGAGASGPI